MHLVGCDWYAAALMQELERRLGRYRDMVDDWPAFLEACVTPLPTVVWENPLAADRARQLADGGDGVAELLRRRGAELAPLGWHPRAWRLQGIERPGHTIEFQLGLLHVQEEMSLLPPLALDPQPGERILDLCAAPGGKTAGIAARTGDSGTLVANDVRLRRLRALRANCERLGLLSVVITPIDGTRFPLEAGPFDRILMDVPCSCEGNLRFVPAVAGRGSRAVLEGRSGLQSTLLGRAWKLLRPGGTLVYSTCTFAPEENELVLDHALGDDAAILPFDVAGLRAAAGVDRWQGSALRPDCANLRRYWPHLNDTGGFTVAVVRKAMA